MSYLIKTFENLFEFFCVFRLFCIAQHCTTPQALPHKAEGKKMWVKFALEFYVDDRKALTPNRQNS
jgi:hypothetical protein